MNPLYDVTVPGIERPIHRRAGSALAACITLGLLLASCSVGFQKSVRSSGTLCSDSRAWFITDAALAAGAAYFAATELNEGTAFIPSGVLLASAAYGVYKRRHCIGHRESATPEQWARDRERAQRRAEERRERERVELAQRAIALTKAAAEREIAIEQRRVARERESRAREKAQARRDARSHQIADTNRNESVPSRRRRVPKNKSQAPTTRPNFGPTSVTVTNVKITERSGYLYLKTQAGCQSIDRKFKDKPDFSRSIAKTACRECVDKKGTYEVAEKSLASRQCSVALENPMGTPGYKYKYKGQ